MESPKPSSKERPSMARRIPDRFVFRPRLLHDTFGWVMRLLDTRAGVPGTSWNLLPKIMRVSYPLLIYESPRSAAWWLDFSTHITSPSSDVWIWEHSACWLEFFGTYPFVLRRLHNVASIAPSGAILFLF